MRARRGRNMIGSGNDQLSLKYFESLVAISLRPEVSKSGSHVSRRAPGVSSRLGGQSPLLHSCSQLAARFTLYIEDDRPSSTPVRSILVDRGQIAATIENEGSIIAAMDDAYNRNVETFRVEEYPMLKGKGGQSQN